MTANRLFRRHPRATVPRHWFRWSLPLVMFVVLGLGWRYPLAGLAVPMVMGMGLAVGFARGRYACGNLCPRGSFYDTFFLPLGGRRPIPVWLRDLRVRWGVVIVLMGFMLWRGLQQPTSLEHWGGVFWWMCAATTAVGVVLGAIYSPRTWCSFCPVGTMAQAAGDGGRKRPLQLDSSCVNCGRCQQVCPMQLKPLEQRQPNGRVIQPDCVQCGACIAACPRKALEWAA